MFRVNDSTASGSVPTDFGQHLIQSLSHCAILLSFSTIWMVTLIAGLRSGLADDSVVQFSTAIFTLLAIWLPIFAISLSRNKLSACLIGSVAVTLGLVSPLLGLVMDRLAVIMVLVFLVYIFIRLRHVFGSFNWRQIFNMLAGSLGLAIFLIVLNPSRRYFVPEEIALGLAHSDSYFHIAITQMIVFFNIPSIGADGLVLQKYHFGSHFVAAGLARALNTNVSIVYLYWVAITLKIQLLLVILWCGALVAPSAFNEHSIFRRFVCALIFILIGVAFIESESFLLAISIYLGTIPLAALLTRCKDGANFHYRLGLVTLIITAFICATAKVSVGYFCAINLLWIAWCGRSNRVNVALCFLGMIALAAYTVAFLAYAEGVLTGGGIHVLLASYSQYVTFATLISYAAPVIILLSEVASVSWIARRPISRDRQVVLLRASYKRISSLRDAHTKLIATSGWVQILVITTVSCVLILVSMPIGSNMAYFSGVLLFMSAALMPGRFLPEYKWQSMSMRLRMAISLLVGVLFMSGLYGFALDLNRTVSALMRAATGEASQLKAEDAGSTRRQLMESLSNTGTFFGAMREQLELNSWMKLMRILEQKRAVGSKIAVYVPPSSDNYWTRLRDHTPYWCMASHLMIPAQIGVPMLRGITPLRFETECMPPGLIWYGFGKDQDLHRTIDLSNQELCENANTKGMNAIYVVNSTSTLSENHYIECQHASK